MLLFEFDGQYLHPAHLGNAASEPLEPEVMEAVRRQVLQIIGRPVFPVSWESRDGSHAAPAAPNRLIAMDPSGQVITIQVTAALDSAGLVDALARSGRTATLGWADLAARYPHGTEAFQREWSLFRQSLPPRPVPGPRLYVVTGEIAPEVRPALEALADSGVEVFEVGERTLTSGRRFLQVTQPCRVPVPTASAYAALHAGHRPDLAIERDEDLSRLLGPGAFAAEPADAVAAPPEQPSAEPAAAMAEIARAAGGNTPLLWVRQRRGTRYEATLTPSGFIALPDGAVFADPSEAAVAVSGHPGVDGWTVWRFGEGGPTLADARLELADARREAPASSGRRRARS